MCNRSFTFHKVLFVLMVVRSKVNSVCATTLGTGYSPSLYVRAMLIPVQVKGCWMVLSFAPLGQEGPSSLLFVSSPLHDRS